MENKIKIFNIKNNKYKLIRGISGVLIPIVAIGSLAGCMNSKEKYEDSDEVTYSFYDDDLNYYNDDQYYYNDNTSSTYSNIESSTPSYNTNNGQNNNNLSNSYELDQLSLNIINSNVNISANSLKKYIDDIKVDYPYSNLYGVENSFNQYESTKKYKSNFTNLFSGNSISSETIYNIVKRNNSKENLVSQYIMSDTDLKSVCNIIADLLSNYANTNKNIALN